MDVCGSTVHLQKHSEITTAMNPLTLVFRSGFISGYTYILLIPITTGVILQGLLGTLGVSLPLGA